MKTGQRGRAARVIAWLASALLCSLAVLGLAQGSANQRETLVILSTTQPTGSIPSSSINSDTSSAIFVPVLLTASGRNNSSFTSELTLTNRGTEEATLHYTYTAHRGGGSGRATDRLAPGQQRIQADAIAYLTNLGIPIPGSGNRIGTLRVEVSGSSGVGVSVRTTTLVADGRAGLAYPGIATAAGFAEAVYLCGLRQNRQDRSNVAVQNMGTSEQGNVTLRTTVYSGGAENRSPHVLPDVILPPGGFHQYNGILDLVGFDNGYVKVERVEGVSPFYAYGVINDNFNSDGSFVFPVTAGSLMGTTGQTLPVIVETGEFASELTVTNFSEEAKTLRFRFVADELTTPDRTARFSLEIGAGRQRILPDVIDTQLRQKGAEGVSGSRGGLAGALFVRAESGDMSGIAIGARTSSSDGLGGQYGVFYHAVPDGGAFTNTVWIDALQQNDENRSNLALVNTGEVDGSPSVFQLDIYDGTTGMLAETVVTKPIAPRGWHQINGILLRSNPDTRQGYIRIEKVSGNNPFLAYGVINDGGAPGERSGDGAYLPATGRIIDPGTEGLTGREVLEALFHATGGPDWSDNTNWLSTAPLSEWFGVETDGHGRVTGLDLSHNQLSGTIPPALDQLPHLQSLDLEGNRLSGAIPRSLQRLSELMLLDIRDTDLCVPADAAFQAWLSTLSPFRSSGIVCDGTRRVLFSAEAYEVKEGASVTVSVRMIDRTEAPARSTEIPLTATPGDGATAADFSGVPVSVTITAPAIEASFVVMAVEDNLVDHGETVALGFRRPLPSGITAGTPDTATVTIIDPGTEAMTDREVLEAFYLATGGPDWSNNTNWLSAAPLSEWRGVETDSSGRVTSLAPRYHGLIGKIPPVLGHLTRLQVLDLAGNDLSGTIPPELGHLSRLEKLHLGHNRLSGAIPPELGGLSHLQVLDFTANQLSGEIPPELGHLSRLEKLHLDHNRLSGAIPPELGGLSHLQVLDFTVNQLSGEIPPELGGLSHLQVLDFLGNRLSGAIPPELGGLTHLRVLDLTANRLSGAIPPELGGLARLQRLNLLQNMLNGTIPSELGHLSRLEGLLLGYNRLSGAIPVELAELTHLDFLNLENNELSGVIPPVLGQLTRLAVLGLGGNRLKGALPKNLRQLSRLQVLNIRNTDVCIPTDAAFEAWLGTIATFHSSGLVCDGTRRVLFSAESYEVKEGETVEVVVRLIDRTGDVDWSAKIPLTAMPGGGATAADYSGVPESVTLTAPATEAAFDFAAVADAPFDSGETVVLGFRQPLPSGFTTGYPATATVTIIDPGTEEVTDREVLEALYHATGGPDWRNNTHWLSAAPISEWFGVETDGNDRVTSLNLTQNRLTGRILPALGQLGRLQELDLGFNNLSGEIPPELGQLFDLQVLDLYGTQLSGEIPTELGELTNLQELDLGFNNLSGEIPPELAELIDIRVLILRGNRLSGEIPPGLLELFDLQVLDLGVNDLSGEFPVALAGLTNLRELDLSGNNLSGEIPPELGGLTNLQVLDLAGNDLSGEIPVALAGMTNLRGLRLSGNKLGGEIPPELGRLTHLQYLALNANDLSGAIPPELAGLTNLQVLNLWVNRLSGQIPAELGALIQLQKLFLSFNRLSGAIPPELGGLTQLEWLDLEANDLSGAIPPELAGLTHLRVLSFDFNPQLSGTLPPGLQHLPLRTLNLMATSVCVSEDAELQERLAMIEQFTSSGLTCGRPPAAMPSIDIALFYTPAARRVAGGKAEIEALADLMVAETNQAYEDSGVNQRIGLVAREEVSYEEEGRSAFLALDRLADPSDGYMDQVHEIREQAGADLVHLIADVANPAGLAYMIRAYALTCVSCDSSIFAHELGHNMGLSHDRYVDASYGLLSYSYGYVNQRAFEDDAPESARWETIMAYPDQCSDVGFSCDWIMRFSNPNQTYLGDPLGVTGDQRTTAVDGPADAVRTLNLTRHSVADFRPRASANQMTMPSTLSQVRPMVRTDGSAALFPGGSLFRAASPNERGAASQRPGGVLDRATLRRREVRIDMQRLARVVEGEPRALRLNLFDNVVLTGIVERWTPTFSGGTALSGRLAGVPGGAVTLVVNGSVVAGTVRLPGSTYRIQSAGGGRHAIIQVDPSLLPQGCGTVSRRPGRER